MAFSFTFDGVLYTVNRTKPQKTQMSSELGSPQVRYAGMHELFVDVR